MPFRELVEVRGIEHIRHLRDLCERARHAEGTYLARDLIQAQQTWLERLATELERSAEDVIELLRRFRVVSLDATSLRSQTVRLLRLVDAGDPEGTFEAIHSFVAQHPDGAIRFDADFVLDTILGGRLPTRAGAKAKA